MEKLYEKSLLIIKLGKTRSVKQYTEMLNYFQALNVESLKYISGMNFSKIIKLAREAE